MREIKFRLRDRHNKIVGYEKWYEGQWHPDNDPKLSPDSGYWEAQPCWLYSKDNKKWTPTYIPHRYKDQYTGLKDKNSKEIYEGDIVRVILYGGYIHTQCSGNEWHDDWKGHKRTRRGKIVWDGETHQWLFENASDSTPLNCLGMVEEGGGESFNIMYREREAKSWSLKVIGNIWESPHLLDNNSEL